jgi:hypothetical protein
MTKNSARIEWIPGSQELLTRSKLRNCNLRRQGLFLSTFVPTDGLIRIPHDTLGEQVL